MIGRSSRLAAFSGAALLAALAAPVAVAAQPATYSFNIPSQDLGGALRAYARAARQQVSFDGALVRGKLSAPVSGRYTADDGLRALLAGSGLSFTRGPRGVVLVIQTASADAAAASAARQAFATRSDEPEASPTVAELIVTAQKFEQKLKDVPLSVSVVTGSEIAERGATDIEAVQFSVPNLSLFKIGGPGTEVIQIGGVSDTLGTPTVGEYLDEIPITGLFQQNSIDVKMLDMARVEVLRGPQGTLYGEGAMGGAIHFITNAPNLTTYSGMIEGELNQITGGGAGYKVNGMVNLPIIPDKLGLRLVAGEERDGGWIESTLTGQTNINVTQATTLRGTLLAQPTDRLEVSLTALHQQEDSANNPYAINGMSNAAIATPDHNLYNLVNGVIKYDFGPVKLVESAGYIDLHSVITDDLSYAFVPLLDAVFGLPVGFITQTPLVGEVQSRVFSDELRLSSSGEGRFNWTAGAYYRRFTGSGISTVTTAPGSLGFPLEAADSTDVSEAGAVFGEANYQLTAKLNVLIGARYYRDRLTETGLTASFGAASPPFNETATFSSFDPRFNVRYEFSPTAMVYLNIAKGFRSGGFNPEAPAGFPTTFNPDWIWTYEVGTKDEFFDNRLELDGDVYRSDWSDVQSAIFPPAQAFTLTESGGGVTGWGADISVTARPLAGLSVRGTYGWNNLAYTDSTAQKAIGDPVDYAVHNSGSVSVDYRARVFGETQGFARVDYQHRGPSQLTERPAPPFLTPARDTVDARIGLDFGPFEASLYADNLFNDRTLLLPPGAFTDQNVEQPPRTIGIDVRARF